MYLKLFSIFFVKRFSKQYGMLLQGQLIAASRCYTWKINVEWFFIKNLQRIFISLSNLVYKFQKRNIFQKSFQ